MTSAGDPPSDAAGPPAGAAGPARGRPGRAAKAQGGQASVWDLPEHGTRGPRPRHDRAAITAIAVRIADADGLEAVSMRRVAGELGIAIMSLYNYVPAKDHLVQLMTDQLAGEYVYPVTPGPDPRAAIADLAGQAREIARRHPWLGELMQRPVPPGPNGLRYLDYFLGLLAGSGLDTGAKLEVIAIISGFATMYGAMQAALPAERTGIADPVQQNPVQQNPVQQNPVQQNALQVQALARAAASGHYPNLAAALAAGGPPRSQDDIFESCIGRLIDLAG